jgi:hypothetical protein
MSFAVSRLRDHRLETMIAELARVLRWPAAQLTPA